MKLKNTAPAVAPAPAEPISEPADDAGFGGFGGDEQPKPQPEPSNDKPFDEPFDAGVEADEESDPKRFIEQLTGKLGQSLRKYNEEQGQPDFVLEKFVINSILSATHTAEMDEDDRKDIIKKVNTAGEDNEDNSSDNQDDSNDGFGDSDESDNEFGGGMADDEASDEEGLEEMSIYEGEMGNLFLDKAKKNEMFQDGSNDFMNEDGGCWHNAERVPGTKKGTKGSCRLKENYLDELNKSTYNNTAAAAVEKGDEGLALDFLKHSNEMGIGDTVSTLPNGSSNNYMYWQNLKTIAHAATELLKMNYNNVDDMLANGHAWAVDHIATSADDIEEVYHFLEASMEYDDSLDYDGETEGGYEDEYGSVEDINLNEAKYHGKKVKLGKPSSGDVKKFKVFVQNKKGKVVKVNFGDPKMEIKRDNLERRKSFRARHKCSQAKDRTTPKYWSCRMWSSTPVSKMVAESESDLTVYEKNSIFDKNYLKMKIQETFNHESAEPMIEPQVKPAPSVEPKPDKVQPNIAPSRKNKPFLPMPSVTPNPKANK